MKLHKITLLCFIGLLAGCSTLRPKENIPRLLITVTASKNELTRNDTVKLTLRAENIGDVPFNAPNKVEKSGVCTVDWGGGEWGLMSPDYFFGPGGPVTVSTFKGFSLQPGETFMLTEEFKLSSNNYRFPAGIYFADARIHDSAMMKDVQVKVVPCIIQLIDKE
jgi:hypothetical protein